MYVDVAYWNYGDWNGSDYQSDVMTPQRIVQRRNGVTIFELTTKVTNTYNPYVIVPVPPQIQKAWVTR